MEFRKSTASFTICVDSSGDTLRVVSVPCVVTHDMEGEPNRTPVVTKEIVSSGICCTSGSMACTSLQRNRAWSVRIMHLLCRAVTVARRVAFGPIKWQISSATAGMVIPPPMSRLFERKEFGLFTLDYGEIGSQAQSSTLADP